MRATYDPSATNAVVVFTDGANDFDAGISLREFQDKARADARAHPRAPIVLVTIGIGAQADLKALKAMTAPVGGRTYRADTPAALQTVLFDAIANRTPGRPS
jgi:Ca-activated chloride channel family protein